MFKASIGIRFRRANSNRGRYSSGGVFQTFSHSAWRRNSLTLSLAGYPAIEYRLQAAGKHFEADDHVRAQRVQPREHLQLPLVVIGVVMLFAEQQHVASDQVGQDLLLADGLRLLIGQDRPAGRRQTGLGLGFCVPAALLSATSAPSSVLPTAASRSSANFDRGPEWAAKPG
jgi:hypothetical protein